MGISIEAVSAAGKGKGSTRKVGARVTSGVLAQVEAKGEGQACIAIRGDEALSEYRGELTLRLDGSDYTLFKSDSHACWATKQGDNVADFVGAFNTLAETPNKVRGEIILGDASADEQEVALDQ
jgi:hypothetical protein